MKNSKIQFYFVWWFAIVGSGSGLFGRKCKQNFSFVPDAGTKSEEKHEISEPALFRFLLNEETMEQLVAAEADMPEMLDVLKNIDKESKITELEIHQSSTGLGTDFKGASHVFIVFQTTSETEGDDWWSLEKNLECFVLQRSGNKDDVKNKLYGAKRINVEPIKKGLKGKGTIQDLFVLLWAHQIIEENYDVEDSICQAFVTLVSKQMTEIGYEYEGDFECSPPPETNRKTKILDCINILLRVTEWGPFLTSIYLENADLVDKVIQSGEFDDDDVLRQETIYALQFAIVFSKTKMAELLLQPPLNVDPTARDVYGRDALQVAGMYAVKTEIIDLLLAHDKVKIDDVNESGLTALHAAALQSNFIAVKHLISNGAHPNIFDKDGLSPLHVAAKQRDGNPIIDLLLEAQKVKGMGNVNDQNEQGETALHYAALASNEITAEHLIKKGADANRRDMKGYTPLHVAATHAKNMQIIDLLLENRKDEATDRKDVIIILACATINDHGLEDKIVARLVAKGIASIEESESTQVDVEIFRMTMSKNSSTERIGENGVNVLHFVAMNARTTDVIDIVLETSKFDINEGDNEGNTPLHYAIVGFYPTINTAHLLQKGADPNVAGTNGITPLHSAAGYAEDVQLVELLLNHPDVDIDCLDNLGRNALDYAMANKDGHSERIAKLLKEKGVGERERKMRQALDRALKDSDVEMIHTLIKKGLKISTAEWNKKNVNALHVASFHAMTTDLIDVVLETGEFDINGVDDDGLTPLHHALMGINPTTNVLHLIQLGADPGITEKEGIITFLDSATINAINPESKDYFHLHPDPEAMGVGYCDKQEYYFYPTNVCRVSSYALFLNLPIYKKDK